MKSIISLIIQYLLGLISEWSVLLRRQINQRCLAINIADMNHRDTDVLKLFEKNRMQLNQLGMLNKLRRILKDLLRMRDNGSKIPKLAYLLLSLSVFCHKYDDSILGDMNEQFHIDSEEYGILIAKYRYWWQVCKSIPLMILQRLIKKLVRKFK